MRGIPTRGRSRLTRGVAAACVVLALAAGAATVAVHSAAPSGGHDPAVRTTPRPEPLPERASGNPSAPAAPSTATEPDPDAGTALDTVSPDGDLVPLPASADPVAFASSAARALFAWDTTAPVSPAEYKGRLLEVADPTGQESPGLVADLATYLPSPAAWDFLRDYDTRQWLQIRTAAVPDSWTRTIARTPDVVAPGTFAVTIDGVRHRAGVWDGAPVATASDIALTVFVVCAPTYPTCSLLRLTQPDRPLR